MRVFGFFFVDKRAVLFNRLFWAIYRGFERKFRVKESICGMEENKKYIYAMDLSMSCSGVTIFDEDANCVLITSVETKTEKEHQLKLKLIADRLLELRKKYKPDKIIIEQGFVRFNLSTQAIFKVVGLVQYLFSDIEQIFYQATLIKKMVGGKGNLKKDELQEIILKQYPELVFKNFDESDSYAVGMTYFELDSKGDEK
jgi:Holliday junction resolvasome RuvABC endonuclease subunit